MSGTDRLVIARSTRNQALTQASRDRAHATREAETEYSETVAKLRERFEIELADALAHRRACVRPAHRAFNEAIIRAEEAFAHAMRQTAQSEA